MGHPREGGRKVPFGVGQQIDRRAFLRRSAAAAAAVPAASAILAACGPPPKPPSPGGAGAIARPDNPVTLPVNQNLIIPDGMPAEEGPLEIYNWEDYIKPKLIPRAEEALGVEINVSTFNTMSEAITKLTTANLQYDVFMGVTKDVISRLVVSDLLRPLNHSYIPNISNLWSSFTEPGKPFWDVGQQYTVPYTVYTTGIGYRFDPDSPNSHITLDVSGLHEEIPAMKNPYDILWDTKWRPFVHLLDDYREVLSMAMLRRGETDLNTSDPMVIARARDDLLKGIDTMDWKLDIHDYTDMPEGESYIHQGWSGDFVSVQYFYPGWSPRNVISYWYPDDGRGAVGGDHFALLASGRNPVLAHQFLNFMLDFDNAMYNFQWNGYIPPQNRVEDPTQLLRESPNPLRPYNVIPPEMPRAVVTQKDLDNGFEQLQIPPDVDELWKQAWESVKTA